MAHKHSVYDTDSHFQINAVTRAIVNVSQSKVSLMQYDHDSERFTFEMPRKIDGHDMMLCDVVQVHYINIDARDKTQTSKDVYEVGDLQISPESDDVVICSWLISGNATKYAGALSFLLKFKCTDDDGSVVYVWNTATHTGISVSSGIDNGESVVTEYSDVLEAWKAEVVADSKAEILASVDSEIEAKTAEAFDKIEEKASEAVTAAAGKIDKYSNALKGTASGEVVGLTDVSPIEHEMGVKVWGRNLLNPRLLNLKNNGGVMQIAHSPSYDYDNDTATITMNGEGTNDNNGVYGAPWTLEVGKTYCISFDIRGADGKKVQCGFSSKKREITLTPEYVRYSYDYTFAEGSSSNILFYSRSTANGGLAVGETMQFRNVQIEEGTTATDYAPYVEDISAVKVKKYGKNLADIYGFSAESIKTPDAVRKLTNPDYGTTVSTTEPSNVVEIIQEKNSGTGSATNYRNGYFYIGVYNRFLTVDTVTLSFDLEIKNNPLNITEMGAIFNDGDIRTFVVANGRCSVTLPYSENGERQSIEIRNNGCSCVMSNIQLEIGSTATEYEPFLSEKYPVSADGTVEGVTPIYPTTTLMTDTAGAVIDCTYNRDINKAFEELYNAIISTGGNV